MEVTRRQFSLMCAAAPVIGLPKFNLSEKPKIITFLISREFPRKDYAELFKDNDSLYSAKHLVNVPYQHGFCVDKNAWSYIEQGLDSIRDTTLDLGWAWGDMILCRRKEESCDIIWAYGISKISSLPPDMPKINIYERSMYGRHFLYSNNIMTGKSMKHFWNFPQTGLGLKGENHG